MKTALMIFLGACEKNTRGYIDNIKALFYEGGIDVSIIEILSLDDDLSFKRRLEEFKDTVDQLIVVGGNEASFDLKGIIASSFDTAFIENENAKTFLDAVSKAKGRVYPENYAFLPMTATVIPNILGGYQGFMLDEKELSLAVLPGAFDQVKLMSEKYVIPYLENKSGVKRQRLILKYFGDQKAVHTCIEKAKEAISTTCEVDVVSNYNDVTIKLSFDEKDQLKDEFIRFIIGNLREDIYAEFDTSLHERLFDLLRLKKVKVSVAESFTGGRIASAIVSNSGVSEYFHEGIVSYSNRSKLGRLGVRDSDLKANGAVSSIVAYQMAVGLLKSGDCDLAISTTGIAGPKSDNTAKPVGLCYIGIGMKDGVHTYKYNFSGNREEITETAKNTALFLAIKKLKNI